MNPREETERTAAKEIIEIITADNRQPVISSLRPRP